MAFMFYRFWCLTLKEEREDRSMRIRGETYREFVTFYVWPLVILSCVHILLYALYLFMHVYDMSRHVLCYVYLYHVTLMSLTLIFALTSILYANKLNHVHSRLFLLLHLYSTQTSLIRYPRLTFHSYGTYCWHVLYGVSLTFMLLILRVHANQAFENPQTFWHVIGCVVINHKERERERLKAFYGLVWFWWLIITQYVLSWITCVFQRLVELDCNNEDWSSLWVLLEANQVWFWWLMITHRLTIIPLFFLYIIND